MKSCSSPAILMLRSIAVAGAIGLAAQGAVALAQGKPKPSAAPSTPDAVSGVTVKAAPRSRIPPGKKAGLDAAAAKRKTWDSYRATTPTPTPASTPPAGVSAEERAENYPGLHAAGH